MRDGRRRRRTTGRRHLVAGAVDGAVHIGHVWLQGWASCWQKLMS